MYLRIIDDIKHYPYTIQDLRDSLPNVSLPATMTNEQLEEWKVYEVLPTPYPNDYTKDIVEGEPTLIDGTFYQNWVQTPTSEEEINIRITAKWFEVRQERNQLLTDCDWTQLADIPSEIKTAWTEYRQALRNITNQENPFNIVWPVKP